MIKITKDNAEYDIEEKDLDKWIRKGFKKTDSCNPNFGKTKEIEDTKPKQGKDK